MAVAQDLFVTRDPDGGETWAPVTFYSLPTGESYHALRRAGHTEGRLIGVTIVACHERRPGGLSERTMPPAARPRAGWPGGDPCSEADDRRF